MRYCIATRRRAYVCRGLIAIKKKNTMSDDHVNTTEDEPVSHYDEAYPEKISPENQREIDAFIRLWGNISPIVVKINAVCAAISAGETPRQKKNNARAKEHADDLMNRNKQKVEWFMAKYTGNFLFFDVEGVLYGTFSSDARALEYLVAYSWKEAGHTSKTRGIARLDAGLLTNLATRPIKWIPAMQATRI